MDKTLPICPGCQIVVVVLFFLGQRREATLICTTNNGQKMKSNNGSSHEKEEILLLYKLRVYLLPINHPQCSPLTWLPLLSRRSNRRITWTLRRTPFIDNNSRQRDWIEGIQGTRCGEDTIAYQQIITDKLILPAWAPGLTERSLSIE